MTAMMVPIVNFDVMGLTTNGTVLLEKLTVSQLVNKLTTFHGLLPRPQEPSTCPYPKPEQSSLCPHILFRSI